MDAPPPLLSGYDNRLSWRSRISAFLLSLGVMALIVLALLQLGVLAASNSRPGGNLTAVQLSAAPEAARKKTAKRAAAKPRQVVVTVPRPVPTPVQKPPPFKIIKLSRQEFAAWDISGMTRKPADDDGSGDTAPTSGAAYGPGAGPGGARLYNAEWYRQPSNAELGGYLKAGAPPGSWALIACQTIDRYHVENCQELDESPRGSGLARAMRQAAWQFLVRPPRLGGKPIPGAWVRIRISFTQKPVSEAAVLPGAEG